ILVALVFADCQSKVAEAGGVEAVTPRAVELVFEIIGFVGVLPLPERRRRHAVVRAITRASVRGAEEDDGQNGEKMSHRRPLEQAACRAKSTMISRQLRPGDRGGRTKKSPNPCGFGLWEIIPAASYSPTRLPVQYHRLRRA